MRSVSYAALLLHLALFDVLAWGQNNPNKTPEPPEFEVPNLWWVSLQMLIWLLVIILLIFITIWLIKKLATNRASANRRKPISLLFQETIGPGRSICLVQVFNQILIIGVTNTQISYLSTLEDDEMDLVSQWLEDDALPDYPLTNRFQFLFQRFCSGQQQIKADFNAKAQRTQRPQRDAENG